MFYYLQKHEDGSYAIFNRECKPVGFNTRDYFNYQEFPVTTTFKGTGSGIANKLSYKGSEATDTIYLYNDGCVPIQSTANMNVCLKKMDILAKLKHNNVLVWDTAPRCGSPHSLNVMCI